MKTSTYSKETKTVIELFERLSASKRKLLLEKVLQLIPEQQSESEWEQLFESSPAPLIQMANEALQEYKSGKSKPMKL